MYSHSGHCLEVFLELTIFNGTPSFFALYVTKFLNSPKLHFECLSLLLPLKLTVVLELVRIFVRSSIPIALAVPLAFETMTFDITWLSSFLNLRSLPDNFFNFLFADLVP